MVVLGGWVLLMSEVPLYHPHALTSQIAVEGEDLPAQLHPTPIGFVYDCRI